MSDSEQEIYTDAALADRCRTLLAGQKYMDKVTSLVYQDNPCLVINYNDILNHTDSASSSSLIDLFGNIDMDKGLDALAEAAYTLMKEIEPVDALKRKPVIRITNYDESIGLRSISTDDLNKMRCFDCIIAKLSEEKPYLTTAAFQCRDCGHILIGGNNRLPKACISCNSKLGFELVPSKCKFTSYRNAIIQELPEDITAGALPLSKHLDIFGTDLTKSEDVVRTGSRVKVTAIVRLDYDKNTLEDLGGKNDPLNITNNNNSSSSSDNVGTTFILKLQANNIEPLKETDSTKAYLSQLDIAAISNYRNNPQLNQILIDSFAPHVFGYDEIKETLLLSLIGASNISNVVKKRGDINILLVGNAGVAKSQMLIYASKIAPRSIYLSGRGSSAVGLTAAVIKDERTGTMMLEAGACVLADKGTCVIDEFDKLQKSDRSALHEVMEQQTCSVAKGGIVATLNARTAILAAANPIDGTYNSYKTLAENTGYPPSMISRFDFIFVIKDIINESRDTDIANTMLSDNPLRNKSGFTEMHLAKYVQFIRTLSLIEPQLSNESKELIRKYYIKLRKRSELAEDGTPSALTITARLVDVLQRASIARAKLLQKDKVDTHDVNRVIYLLSKMYESFGVNIDDKEVQTINLGLLYGKPASKMDKKKLLIEICDAITANNRNKELDIEHLITDLVTTKKFVTRADAEDFIRKAIQAGLLDHIRGPIYRYNRDVLDGNF